MILETCKKKALESNTNLHQITGCHDSVIPSVPCFGGSVGKYAAHPGRGADIPQSTIVALTYHSTVRDQRLNSKRDGLESTVDVLREDLFLLLNQGISRAKVNSPWTHMGSKQLQ